MFYRKELLLPKARTARVSIPLFLSPDTRTAESLLPKNTARTAYNYRLSGGALTTGAGLSAAAMPSVSGGEPFALPSRTTNIVQMFVYTKYDYVNGKPDDRLIILDGQGYFYQTKLYESTPFTSVVFPRTFEKFDAVNYRYNGEDVLLMSAALGLYIYDGVNNPYVVSAAPKIKSMCVHSERLYASLKGDNTSIWFSDTFDPTNWNVSLDDGGFIDFADDGGYVRKVLQFNDSVYIFRDFSVERLIAYGEQSEFSVFKVCSLGAKIIPSTILLCGEYVMFMTRDGLFRFDGASSERIFESVTAMIDTGYDARACFDRDKYYLAAKVDFKDGREVLCESAGDGKNALFEFDVKSRTVNIMRGVSINDITAIKTQTKENVFACLSPGGNAALTGIVTELNGSGTVPGAVTLPMMWTSAYNTSGAPDKRKLIRKVSFVSKYDAVLTVTADGEAKAYPIKGGLKPVGVNINKACSAFSVSFGSGGQTDISDAVVTVDYY
ncbi:MAG: hypothetical protein LBT30_04145 [Clostridiales bacterium]|jgi:hypothetical protein|nr:hypothetical protein [Clostridiales bacterium]